MTAMALQHGGSDTVRGPALDRANELNTCACVRDLRLSHGGQRILDGASFELRSGEITILRGGNGSGKTTLLNLLSGYLSPDGGVIRLLLGGRWIDVPATGPERLAQMGLGRLWQDIRLFPTMTVLDNVLAATPNLSGTNPLLALFAFPAALRQFRRAREQAMENLAAVKMEHRASSSCDMLSVGQMKRVAIARLLQTGASLLLLDEPLAGLDSDSSASLVRDLDWLRRERSKTMLIVEHRYDPLMGITDRVLFLHAGRVEEGEERDD